MTTVSSSSSSSPSPVDLYSAMRTSGQSAAAASVLDMYCAATRGDSTNPGASGCRGDMSPTPSCSPDVSPGVAPLDLQTIAGSAAVDPASLRLMLGGSGRHQLAHHGGLPPPLPLLGVGSPMTAINSQPSTHRHHHLLESSAFYLPPNLQMASDMASPEAWNGLYNSAMGLASFDPRTAAEYQSYLQCYGGLHDVRRKNATRESTSTLKSWLIQHIKNPYPTKGEKIMLAIITKMTLTQVSTWFANARRRLKKENKMQWSPRQRNDDDDEDADDDESPNDVMNGSFSVSDDECSNDVIVDDRAGLNGAESPDSRLLIDNTVGFSEDRSTSYDNRRTFNDVETRRIPDERTTNTSNQSCSSVASDSLPSASSAARNAANGGEDSPAPASKPRIWSIAELATSSDDKRKHSKTTNSSIDSRLMTSSSLSSSSSPLKSTDFAGDLHSWVSSGASDDAIQMYLRRQYSERGLSPPSAAVTSSDQFLFPVATVEALRWQMAAAACRAATAAAAAAASARTTSQRLPNVAVEGSACTVSGLR